MSFVGSKHSRGDTEILMSAKNNRQKNRRTHLLTSVSAETRLPDFTLLQKHHKEIVELIV